MDTLLSQDAPLSHPDYPVYPGPYIDGKPVFSASRLKTFRRCRALFTAKYILALPIPTHPSAIVGKAVHTTIERRWRSLIETGRDVPSVTQTYREAVIEAMGAPEDDDEYIHGYIHGYKNEGNEKVSLTPSNSIDRYIEDGLALVLTYNIYNHPVPRDIEYEFVLPYPDADAPICYVRGFFDYVYDDGFVDIKTSRREPTDLSSDIQFIMYHWAFTRLFGYPPRMAYWYHIRTDTYIPYEHAGIDLLNSTIIGLLEFIEHYIDDYRRGMPVAVPCSSCFTPSVCHQALARNPDGWQTKADFTRVSIQSSFGSTLRRSKEG